MHIRGRLYYIPVKFRTVKHFFFTTIMSEEASRFKDGCFVIYIIVVFLDRCCRTEELDRKYVNVCTDLSVSELHPVCLTDDKTVGNINTGKYD